jgi:phosphotriesterase-related protein
MDREHEGEIGMGQIETVRGPIEASELGATLMHEHIFIKNQELEENYPNAEWSDEGTMKVARDGLQALYAKGIRTLVDLTVLGLGRSIPRIKQLAGTVDINIVVATGYYTAEHLSGYFKNHGPGLRVDMPEPLDAMFLRDIEVGIADTGVKAAIIKVVTDEQGITADVERVLRSAAHTQLATGVPISTHTNAPLKTGLLQQAFFKKEGVDLDRVVIGHSGDTTDIDYLKELIDNGSPLGLDRFGINARLPEADRIDTVVKLIDLGYADRITLSHDAGYFSINTEPSHRPVEWHHAAISDRILPALRSRGVSQATIDQIMVTNPARILST